MGSLKSKVINTSEDTQTHKLTDQEANYLRLLNAALQYHTMGQKIMSGFLYIVCVNRLGYKNGVNLQFQFDFNTENNPNNELTVTLLPATPEVQE